MAQQWHSREIDEYPLAVRQMGAVAFRVFDEVERGLIEDGYTQDETDMLLQINLDQILTKARAVAKEESAADKRRKAADAAREKRKRDS